MTTANYKVLSWLDPVGQGVSDACFVGISGVAKTNSAREPNIVAAELIAARLGQAILLPIPPAFIVDRDGEPWFTSLDFNLAGEALPPVNGGAAVDRFPDICAGIVVFDAWIMNEDRHCRNLACHTASGRLQVFDHSRALMPHRDQREFAANNGDNLAIGSNHCLAAHLVDELGFTEWIRRIQEIPTFYIRQVLKDAVTVGLRSHNVNFFFHLLLERRNRLRQLLKDHRSSFPALQFGLDISKHGVDNG